jgi:hypothetical protein
MKRQQYSPFDDLDMISTNVGVKALVNKYWAPELKSVDLRTKAKRHYNSNQFGVALALYNDAFKLGNYTLLPGRRCESKKITSKIWFGHLLEYP